MNPAANERNDSVHGTVRIAAVADIHCMEDSVGQLRGMFRQAADMADVLLLCGDLTDVGSKAQCDVLAGELAEILEIRPVLAILGNHDFESGTPGEVKRIMSEAGVVMLDGDTCEVHGVGFTGVKGFAGGFGKHNLQPWGEEAIKNFVKESQNEAAKLEAGLAKLHTVQRVVLCHYSPIASTVDGEPPEIFPFLGSSHLEGPLNRYHATVAFHGHAHRGVLMGRTHSGVPVYNVSMPVLKKLLPDQPPFRVLELTMEPLAIK